MGTKICKKLIALLALCLPACKKDKPEPATASRHGAGNVYVVCEGNFGSGDAALYRYNTATDSAYGDLYKNTNHQSLGDVFQSMTRIGTRFFLCINNSDKVVVLDTGSLLVTGTISIPKPRYVLPVSNNKIYISTLFSNKVYVADPLSLQVTGIMTMPGENPEGMLLYNNDVYICTWDTAGSKVFKTDANSDQVTGSVSIPGNAPQEILKDREQMLWILSGNQPRGKPALWTRIDPSTGDVLRSYSFPAGADPIKPVFNATKDTLYFIEADYNGGTANNGIYRMGIHAQAVPTDAFVAAKQYQYFWALGVDPATGYIYIGDPKGFTQKGSVYVYRTDGVQIHTFNVGVGPGHFWFE